MKKTLTLVLAAILAAGLVTGLSPNPDNAEIASENPSIDSIVERGGLNPFSIAFSFIQTEPQVDPGQQIRFNFEVDAQYDAPSETNQFIVEVYNCADTDCNNPDQDVFVESDSERIDEVINEGDTFTSEVTYTVPSDAERGSTWGAVVYIWDSDATSDGFDNDGDFSFDEADEAVISDAPETEFVIAEETTDETNGGDTGDTGGDTGGGEPVDGGSSGADSGIVALGVVVLMLGFGVLVFRRLN